MPEEDQRQLLLQFASRAAHDLAGPVDQISSLVALFVQRYKGKLDDDADTLLAHIESARSRLGLTSAGLRKCFQVISTDYVPTSVDMNGTLEAALGPLGNEITQSGAEIQVDRLPEVNGHRDLLILLFHALLDNALKFRRPNVPPKISVTAERSAQGLVFEVSDNGLGIDAQYRDVVFDSFKRLHGHQYSGAGLGLTIARMVVQSHGGSIWIGPAAEGTRVCFELGRNSAAS